MMLSWSRHFVVADCRRVSFLETPAGLCVESSRFKYALPQVLSELHLELGGVFKFGQPKSSSV